MNYKFLVYLIFAGFLAMGFGMATCNKNPVSTKVEKKTPSEEKTAVITEEPAVANENVHLYFGNPSNATGELSNSENYLIEKPQYALSYSQSRGTANWVSWYLSKDWVGSIDRQDDFRADNTLPNGWYQVTPRSYSGSGFDRGHNCPSADRTKSIEDNSATFLMTNMIPQAPTHNRETWGNMEQYLRSLVDDGYDLCIIMGSYGKGGEGANGLAQTIDAGRVTVPANIWKVVVVMPAGGSGMSRVNRATRVIAVNTPNQNNTSSNWGTYRVTVDDIEKATGYDLLNKIPADLQAVLEARRDYGPIRNE